MYIYIHIHTHIFFRIYIYIYIYIYTNVYNMYFHILYVTLLNSSAGLRSFPSCKLLDKEANP